MSYSKTLIIGWYAAFSPNNIQIENGTKEVRFCPTSKKHPTNNNFCPVCGTKIASEVQNKYRKFPHPLTLLEINTQKELDEETGGLVKLEHLLPLKGSRAVFPEFLNTKNHIIFAPGFKIWADLAHSDGFVSNLDNEKAPTIAWIDSIKKVFHVEQVTMNYGVAYELW